MTYKDLYSDCIEIQCETTFCYYDYEKEERIIITQQEAENKEIKYIYIENDSLFIEIEMDS